MGGAGWSFPVAKGGSASFLSRPGPEVWQTRTRHGERSGQKIRDLRGWVGAKHGQREGASDLTGKVWRERFPGARGAGTLRGVRAACVSQTRRQAKHSGACEVGALGKLL